MNLDFATTPEPRKCKHTLTKGGICGDATLPFIPYCSGHASAEDVAMCNLLRKIYYNGRAEGAEWAEEQLEQLRGKVERFQAALEVDGRRFFDEGNQVVEVNGIPYAWSGSVHLIVGEKVVLPNRRVGPVTALGTAAEGPFTMILARRRAYR